MVIALTEDYGNGFCFGERFGATRKEPMTRIEVERSGFFNRWRTVNRGGKVREEGKLLLHDFLLARASWFCARGHGEQARRSRACEAGRPGINRGDPLQVGRRLFMPEARTLDSRRAVANPPEALLAEALRLQTLWAQPRKKRSPPLRMVQSPDGRRR
jgi:hypothetical protein